MIELPQTFLVALAAADGGGFSFGQLAVLVVAAAGLTLVMLSTRRRIRLSRATSVQSASERIATVAARSRAARDMEAVMLELDELSRGIHGRLDTKLVRLEALIRDADQRIEQLAAAIPATPAPPAPARIDVVVGDESTPDHETRQATSDEPRREPHELIHEMADRGANVIDIARKAGRTPGEVELVLALRKTRDEAIPGIHA